METQEVEFKGFKANGFVMLFVMLVWLGVSIWLLTINKTPYVIVGVFLLVCWLIMLQGFTMLEPNEAVVTVFFGKYKGVLKETGFFWVNPFMTKKKVSLRARNLNIDPSR